MAMPQLVAIFCFSCSLLHASESPEAVLEKFNSSSSGSEAIQYLTGIMESQFASLDESTQVQWLEMSRMKSYQAQTTPINDEFQLVFITSLENDEGVVPASAQEYPIIYEFWKVDGMWKINDMMSGHIIVDLFKQKYAPSQFHAQNTFQFDGKRFPMGSAFAYYKASSSDRSNTSVTIGFYPFKFQDRDIEYFKYNSGIVVEENDIATTVTSSLKYPRGEISLFLDEAKKLISYCVNGNYFNENFGSFNYCVQPDAFLEDNLKFSDSKLLLKVKGEGQIAPNGESLSWDIDIELPIFKEGIN